ncbi:hypothetical protein PHMEG_00032238 [Phytophthora megakarya]|uniref:Uncharacterized protein n=1 Tax=Phytophthora megakarya TaxID=4795 RepID=A0A225UVZ7_9STRA|nr:hypothetical protein PHMEG_00032238 [Phytophthora megakarya]
MRSRICNRLDFGTICSTELWAHSFWLYDPLGLNTMDEAFKRSCDTWTKKGDGKMIVFFENTDTKDVTVEVHSGTRKLKCLLEPR